MEIAEIQPLAQLPLIPDRGAKARDKHLKNNLVALEKTDLTAHKRGQIIQETGRLASKMAELGEILVFQ